MALLEAMGSGLPVVATQVEGTNEVMQQNIQGFLVPPEDSDALARALLQLINSPQLRAKMGLEARKRIEDSYTTDLMCQGYLKVMLDHIPPNQPDKDR